MSELHWQGWETVDTKTIEEPGKAPHLDMHVRKEAQDADRLCKCGGHLRRHGIEYRAAVDAPAFGKTVSLKIAFVRFRCTSCGATRQQDLRDFIEDRQRFTRRAKEHLVKLAARRPFEEVAAEFGVCEKAVRNVAREVWSAQDVYNFPTPRYLGIDEIVFKDKESKLKNQKRAVFVDLESGQVLDMLESNDKKAVAKWLYGLPDGHKVRAVAMDFEEIYRDAVSKNLPHAPIVIDRYHIAKQIQDVVDSVRMAELKIKPLRRSNGEKRSQAPANGSAVRHIMSLLRYRGQKLTVADKFDLENFLHEYPRVADAFYAAQEFKKIWNEEHDKFEAQKHFRAWDRRMPESVRPAFRNIRDLIYRTETEVFRYFDIRISNAATEAANGKIQRLILNSIGGMSFEMLRLRARAMTRLGGKRQFHCDTCGKRVDDYKEKRSALRRWGPFLISHDDDNEIWLCRRCKDDIDRIDLSDVADWELHKFVRPDCHPSIAFRASPPDRELEDLFEGGPADIWEFWDLQLDADPKEAAKHVIDRSTYLDRTEARRLRAMRKRAARQHDPDHGEASTQ